MRHLVSPPTPARVFCSTKMKQPVALSRFMSQVIIGNTLSRAKGVAGEEVRGRQGRRRDWDVVWWLKKMRNNKKGKKDGERKE